MRYRTTIMPVFSAWPLLAVIIGDHKEGLGVVMGSSTIEVNDVLCVASNEELNGILTGRSGLGYVDRSVHMAHSEASRNLWFSAEEDIPGMAFEKAKDNQVVVHVGCFAGLFRKRKPSPAIPVLDLPVRIHLSDPLHVTKRTGVFGIVELPQALIKYYAWCKNKYEPNDSIVTEAFFMQKLSPLGLAPKVYYYSDYFDYCFCEIESRNSNVPRNQVLQGRLATSFEVYDYGATRNVGQYICGEKAKTIPERHEVGSSDDFFIKKITLLQDCSWGCTLG